MARYAFHVAVFARPDDVPPGGVQTVAGREVAVLAVAPAMLGRGFDCTFEDFAEHAGRFERMVFEPDGSFVWVAGRDEPAWQVDGLTYDRDGRLLYVELKGRCPAARLDELLAPLGRTPRMFQLVREAVFVDEAEFRRIAAAAAGE